MLLERYKGGALRLASLMASGLDDERLLHSIGSIYLLWRCGVLPCMELWYYGK